MKWTTRKARGWETYYKAPLEVKWKHNEALIALGMESRGEPQEL